MNPSIPLAAILALLMPQSRDSKDQKADNQPASRSSDANVDATRTEENPVIATVGKKKIRLNDLLSEINRLIPLEYYHRKVPESQMQQFRSKAFDSLLVRKLKHLDAIDRKLAISEDEIRQEFRKTLKKAGPPWSKANEKQFEKLLIQYRPLVVRRLLIDKNEARFKTTIPEIQEEMVRKVYAGKLAEDPKAFQAPKECHLRHIFLKVDPSKIATEGKAKREKIEEARKQIQDGRSFSEVALFYSDGENQKQGGDLGFVVQGRFRSKDLNKAAFQLAKGELSEIITTLHGYHLVQCVDIKPTHTLKFTEVKNQLFSWLMKEHEEMARGRWMARLRKRHQVQILRPELITPPASEVSAPELTDRVKPVESQPTAPSSRPAPTPKESVSSRPHR